MSNGSESPRPLHNVDQLIDPADAERRRQDGAVFIDVRRFRPDRPLGDIERAVKVDKAETAVQLQPDSDALGPVLADGLDTEIVVFCNSEYGSDPVVAELNELGYTRVSHVRGGFIAWTENELPVVNDGGDGQ